MPGPLDLWPIPYRLTCVRLGDQDGAAARAWLRALAASGGPWGAENRLDLAPLPLMRQGRGTDAVVREGLGLV